LPVRASSGEAGDPDCFDLARFARWATVALREDGRQHVLLSDGWRRIRLDIVEGSVLGRRPVRLHYVLSGAAQAEPRLLTLRRLLGLIRHGRFPHRLFPREAAMARRVEALRTADALADGASQRDIANALFGERLVGEEWTGGSDFLRSRVRRRIAEAVKMRQGGWRRLLAGGG